MSFSHWPKEVDSEFDPDSLLEMCHNLVTVDNQSQVRFTHLSVQEYLERRGDFTLDDTHSMAATICLRVLLSDRTPTSWASKTVFDYSVSHWMEHASRCAGSRAVLDLLRIFLGTVSTPGKAYRRWYKIALGRSKHSSDYSASSPYPEDPLGHLYSEPLNPVFAVCCFHLGTGLEDFWEWGTFDINSKNEFGETLLYVASLTGNVPIVKSLLENKANVNISRDQEYGFPGRNPFTAAITSNQAKIAVMLLGSGAGAGHFGEEFYTNPLVLSVARGVDETMVKTIIESGHKVEITNTVLLLAAAHPTSACQILEILLARDPTIQVTETILAVVASNDDAQALKMLLAKKWDSTFQITEKILRAAAWSHNVEALETLLATDSTLQTTEAILLTALRNCNERFLQTLLASDFTIRITDDILSASALKGNPVAMEMLLDRDSNSTFKITEAALLVAASSRTTKILKMLLARNSEPTAKITEIVLLVAAANTAVAPEVLEILLATENNIEITEAIVTAAAGNSGCSAKIMEVLVTNARRNNITVNPTALKAAAYFGYPLHFHQLLDRCDKSSIFNRKYQSLHFMHAAVQGGDRSIMESLTELCGECLEADEHGWTLSMLERHSGFTNEVLSSAEPNRVHHELVPQKQREMGIEHSAERELSQPTQWDSSHLPECVWMEHREDRSFLIYLSKCPILLASFLWY